jgi:hypothetical protein
MKASSSRKNCNTKYHYYTCSNHAKYGNCKAFHKTVPAEVLERNVIDEILRIIKSPEIILKINQIAEKQPEIEKNNLLEVLKNLNESWQYLYIEEKRKILQMLLKNVEVTDDGIKINLNLEGLDGFLVELAA